MDGKKSSPIKEKPRRCRIRIAGVKVSTWDLPKTKQKFDMRSDCKETIWCYKKEYCFNGKKMYLFRF